MRINNVKQIEDFLNAVKKCSGTVYLESPYGDRFNLNSGLCQYVAIGELLGQHGDKLELFCDNKLDEQYFFMFFNNHPEIL